MNKKRNELCEININGPDISLCFVVLCLLKACIQDGVLRNITAVSISAQVHLFFIEGC